MKKANSDSSFIKEGELRPLIKGSTLSNRSKYSRRSLVVADFSVGENGYPNNKLYTFILMSLGVMSFLIIVYGLMPSGISFVGLKIWSQIKNPDLYKKFLEVFILKGNYILRYLEKSLNYSNPPGMKTMNHLQLYLISEKPI